MEENKKTDLEQTLPEDFRPVIPEPEIRRKSIVQFSKNYPVEESPTSTHTMSFAQEESRRRTKNAVLYAILLLTVFVITFIATDSCIKISKKQIPLTVPQTSAQAETEPTSETQAYEQITQNSITPTEESTLFVFSE